MIIMRWSFICIFLLCFGGACEAVNKNTSPCSTYPYRSSLEDELSVHFSKDVIFDSIRICEISGIKSYIVSQYNIENGVCIGEIRRLVETESILKYEDSPSGKHFAIPAEDRCPNNDGYTELSAMSKDLDPKIVIFLLDDFKKSLTGKKENFEKYFNLSLLDRYIDNKYSEFIKTSYSSHSFRFLDIYKYSMNCNCHIIRIEIDNRLWDLEAVISNSKISVVSLSNDIVH